MLECAKTFEQYEALVGEVDRIFNAARQSHGHCVRCEVGCCDCCHAVFDLTLVEAVYMNHHFNTALNRKERREILNRAEKVDRQYYQIKKKLQKMYVDEGKPPEEILWQLAQERVPCPFLNAQHQCDVYDKRPITCRVYGIPTSIGGKAHTCEKSGFKEGTPYPTVNLDKMNDRLFQLSLELLREVGAKNMKMHRSLVPPSAAVMIDYDEALFGTQGQEKQ